MIVISAFPGMGKTWYFNNCQDLHSSYDSDSSQFPKDNFPQNYIEYIKGKLKDDDKDIIFVSTHESVRRALIDEGIRFVCLYPDRSMKDELMQRYRQRGSSEAFIENMDKNFDNYITSIEKMLTESSVSGICFMDSTYINQDTIDEIITYEFSRKMYDGR